MPFEDGISIVIPIVTAAITILIFVITRARAQGDMTTTTSINVASVMKTLEDRRDEEKERDKDLKGEMRDMNKNIQDLVSAINLHTHILGENKTIINAMQEKLQELEIRTSRGDRNAGSKGAV